MTTRAELEQTVAQNEQDAGVFEERRAKAVHAKNGTDEFLNKFLADLCTKQAKDAQEQLDTMDRELKQAVRNSVNGVIS